MTVTETTPAPARASGAAVLEATGVTMRFGVDTGAEDRLLALGVATAEPVEAS